MPGAEHNDGHPNESHKRSEKVPSCRADAIYEPKPENSSEDIDAALCCIHTPRSCGMEGKQPGEQTQRDHSRKNQPWTAILSEPKIRKIASKNLRQSGTNKKH